MSSGNPPIQIGAVSANAIGTLEEIQRQGLDPRVWPCCHQPTKDIRGCVLAKKCLFNLRKHGGFKFESGPKYIGYRLVTDKTEGNSAKEDFCSCMVFVDVMQDRMFDGANLRQQGKDGELVAIIAQEGETVIRRTDTAIQNENGDTIRFEDRVEKLIVPNFPRPGENRGLGYSQQIVEAERQRLMQEDDMETQIYLQQRQQRLEETQEDDEPLDLAGPVAEPVKKGK